MKRYLLAFPMGSQLAWISKTGLWEDLQAGVAFNNPWIYAECKYLVILGEGWWSGFKESIEHQSTERLGASNESCRNGTKQPFAEGTPIQIPLSDIELEVLTRAISKWRKLKTKTKQKNIKIRTEDLRWDVWRWHSHPHGSLWSSWLDPTSMVKL